LGERLLAKDGLAAGVDGGSRAHVAVLVRVRFEQGHGEGVHQIVHHVFFAVAVYVERGGGRRRFPSVFHDFTPDNYG
ncbi:hypothetical protein DKP78_26775, partial [Enterococcus faecium]